MLEAMVAALNVSGRIHLGYKRIVGGVGWGGVTSL